MTPFQARLVATANAEYAAYHGIYEADDPLETRIRQYWRAAGRQPPQDVTSEPWSGAFVSWCMKTAGATPAEFKFSARHATFVKAAIQNQLDGQGVFRGQRIEDYAPKPGDIIQNNRGGSVTYSMAAVDDEYVSHSAIVVDFEERDGIRYAVTIGGNEGNTVGRKKVQLLSDGRIQQRPAGRTDRYICVIENLKEAVVPEQAPGGRVHMVIARHGLNLRSGPGIGFAALRLLPFGTTVHVLRQDGDWAQVDLEGDGRADGNVHTAFIRAA